MQSRKKRKNSKIDRAVIPAIISPRFFCSNREGWEPFPGSTGFTLFGFIYKNSRKNQKKPKVFIKIKENS
jgi:hypothetical protein